MRPGTAYCICVPAICVAALRIFAVVTGLLLGLAPAATAFAHAALVRADPADGAVVAQSPASLRLTFNEPVSPLVMRIIGAGGEVMGRTRISTENVVVTVVPPRLPEGTNVLSWRVVSADGHPIGGSLLFAVGTPSAAGADGSLESDPAVKVALWIG